MADTEKITINMSPVDLGQVDLLVSEGFYSNCTDFIRTAIRNQINVHADTVKETVKRKIRWCWAFWVWGGVNLRNSVVRARWLTSGSSVR